METWAQDQAELHHFHAIRHWVFEHTGLHYPERKYSTLFHRLKKLCNQLNLDSLAALNHALQYNNGADLAVKLACAVSTNHTFFFRERETFEFFETKIIPTLPAAEPWRIWSAACSGGDEAYTLALILAEALGVPQTSSRVSILGTDISQTALEQAELAIYSERRIEQVPPYFQSRYFQAKGLGQWGLRPEIRGLCVFRRLNLMSEPWPFKNQFHVIFCRNILYYFDQADQIKLVERLYDITAPGGWLITSVTESLRMLPTRWQVISTGIHRKL